MMFKHILVPLDGSRLAESVISPVLELAVKIHARITLIHIIEESAPENIHGDHHIKTSEEAEKYLQKIASVFRLENIDVNTHVHTRKEDDIVESLVEHASELDHDLIALCAHGESGWKDRLVGSIAQQVIGLGRLPVLLFQPEDKESTDDRQYHFSKFLLALDGEEDHESGVEKAVVLAKRIKVELHLLTVIETLLTLSGSEAATGMLLPSATSAMLEIVEEDALERLEEKASVWRSEGLSVTTDVHRGDPVQWIIKDANIHKCDLIVLGTHGKSGINAFWSGSSAPRIPGLTKIPLLLIPVHHIDVKSN
jgi:nucleotide-binding universal stress UspA family protein